MLGSTSIQYTWLFWYARMQQAKYTSLAVEGSWRQRERSTRGGPLERGAQYPTNMHTRKPPMLQIAPCGGLEA